MLYEDNNKVKAFVHLFVWSAPVCQCSHSCMCLRPGSVFRGTFPCRAALQSWGQKLPWWRECTNGLWVPPRLFWGVFKRECSVYACKSMITFHWELSKLLWYKSKRFVSWSCVMWMQNQEKQENLGSLEDLSQDEPDRVILAEHMNVPRKSPLIRNRKAGSMEVLSFNKSRSLSFNTAYSLVFLTSRAILPSDSFICQLLFVIWKKGSSWCAKVTCKASYILYLLLYEGQVTQSAFPFSLCLKVWAQSDFRGLAC